MLQYESTDLDHWTYTGVVHRVQPYDKHSRRAMHRTTLAGEEPIQ